MLPMFPTCQDLGLRRAIALSRICHHHPRNIRQALEQLPQGCLGDSLVVTVLDQDVEDMPLLINGSPEVTMIPRANSRASTSRVYVQAFQSLDPHATLPYYHVPCMFISPQGVRVMATAAEGAGLFAQVMEGLKACSYGRSELTDLHVQQMSENTAFVSVHRVRYTSDGQELERLGETYTLLRTDDDWTITVAMIYALTPSTMRVSAPRSRPGVRGMSAALYDVAVAGPRDH